MEVELRNKLLETEKMGVIGRTAGATLKRMPSAIYWSGLGVWGLRRFQGSQQEYHASVDQIYSRRAPDADVMMPNGRERTTWTPGIRSCWRYGQTIFPQAQASL